MGSETEREECLALLCHPKRFDEETESQPRSGRAQKNQKNPRELKEKTLLARPIGTSTYVPFTNVTPHQQEALRMDVERRDQFTETNID